VVGNLKSEGGVGRQAEGERGSREDAKARKVGDRVPLLPKTICCSEGVMGCYGLAELGMGPSASMGKSKAVSSHRSPRTKDPESHAETRRHGGFLSIVAELSKNRSAASRCG
jgi:hypothetical protein